jgi:hypothetical protein
LPGTYLLSSALLERRQNDYDESVILFQHPETFTKFPTEELGSEELHELSAVLQERAQQLLVAVPALAALRYLLVPSRISNDVRFWRIVFRLLRNKGWGSDSDGMLTATTSAIEQQQAIDRYLEQMWASLAVARQRPSTATTTMEPSDDDSYFSQSSLN